MEEDPDNESHDCYAQFTGEGGYECERVRARDVFELGKSYRVIGGVAHPSVTYLEVDGVPGSWNSVLFDVDLDLFVLRDPEMVSGEGSQETDPH